MKQKIILLFLFVVAHKIVISQIDFGLRFGGNIATTKQLIQFPKNRIGYYAGFTGDFAISKKFSLRPELIYSSKGHRSTGNIGTEKIISRFNYLNLPLSIVYKADKKTRLLIGPEFGYLLSSKLIIANNTIDNSKNFPQKFDVGILIGIDYAITKFCFLDARYIYGFDQMYYVDGAGVRVSNQNGGNRVFQLGFNVKL